ncbi:transcription initiation factor IIA subunit 1-like [Oscarella lobularis]|uniref:transcription initiation factor IIA subunit 1-like n=1 Tax=Oscarella lobularis TaxID=121494 RepID=UPI0033133666
MASRTNVAGVYNEVIKDVVEKVREKFLNEGVDEQVLQELKQLWTAKVHQTGSVHNWEAGAAPIGRNVYPHASAPPRVASAHAQLTVQGQRVELPVATESVLASQFPGFGAPSKAKTPQLDGSRPEKAKKVPQLDGATEDSSTSSSEDEENDEDRENDEGAGKESGEDNVEEGEPLGSGDDVDSEEEFDTENVVVCQFERVGRMRNRWKFQLKDGIMNLEGKDYIFHKASGEADW